MGNKGGKARKYKRWMMFFGILLVAIVSIWALIGFGVLSIPEMGKEKTSEDGTTTVNIDLTDVTCESSTTPDLKISAYDLENKGSALTEATNLIRKVGDTTWSTFTAGTAITNLEFGEKYEIVMGISTSDQTDNAYGAHFTTDAIPCKELTTVEKGMYNDEIETSLSATFYNADNNAAAQTFTTGQTKTVHIKFNAGNDEVFGNSFVGDTPNVLCLDLNSTEWDTPESVKVAGVEMKKVATPNRHTTGTDAKTYCYEAPVITEDELMFDLRPNADDSNAPGSDGTAYLYAGGYYIDEDSNVASGVEDEEDAAVGTDAADSVTLDFTA
jgi:hypothetical protein